MARKISAQESISKDDAPTISRMDASPDLNAIVEALRTIAVPLVTIDKASIYVVTETASEIHLHLSGAYAGCPGNGFVERALLGPIVKSASPKTALKVTSGLPIPAGARLLEPK